MPSLPLPPADVSELADAVCAEAPIAAQNVIASRSEPLTWDALRLPVYQQLTTSGLLGQVAVVKDLPESPRTFVIRLLQDTMTGAEGLVYLGEAGEAEGRWWLQKPSHAAPPLDTRVEATVHQLLLSTLMLTSGAVAEEVYRRFPGELTPDAGLIETCLRSYGQEITPDHWHTAKRSRPTTGNYAPKIGLTVVQKKWPLSGRNCTSWANDWVSRYHLR
jgi:hypothetical protein